MKRSMLFYCLLVFCAGANAQQQKTENIVLITLDGFRWQELFGGADEQLIKDKTYSFDTGSLKKKFWAKSPEERRKKLMPFVWSTIVQQGQIYGNRKFNNNVDVKNSYWFSYPGYNEILTGYPDSLVNSNDKKPNKNTTILEFLNQQPSFKGKVAAFGSWDVFDAIIHEKRAGLLVSSGIDSVPLPSPAFSVLNRMQKNTHQPLGEGIRPDHLTFNIATQYVREYKPKVLYIAFDETDDYAHGGRYDYYLEMAHMTDKWIGELWNMLQSMPEYRNNTTLLITTDHGRGDAVKSQWTSHGEKVADAHEIWFLSLGAGIPAKGEVKTSGQLYQAQVAQTIAFLLGLEFKAVQPIEPAMKGITE
jgi:hypothetical protein